MKIEIDSVKGFHDFLPPESLKREEIKKIVEKQFKLYGFLPVETPLIEFDELMKSDKLPSETEDSAISERFKLQDRGKRNLGLRYEFTFQLARIFKQNPNIKLPFKRYQIGPLLRDEPVGPLRFRQFTQCDADIIGDLTTNADAECLSLVSDILKELKIPAEIQVNNRQLLSSIIESVEIKKTNEIMRELDKLDKLDIDIVKANLRKYASANQIITLFKILEKGPEFLKENAFPGYEQLEELISLCKDYNVKLKFNPYLARGLSYYTGNIFEVRLPDRNESIAAGGRYDKVVGKYSSRDIPAVGISFGLERLSQLSQIQPENPIKTIIISINKDKEAIKLTKKLRKSDISCITSFGKTGKALEYANSQNVPYAIFLGEEEIQSKKYKLKDMSSGEEKLLSEKQLIQKLSK